MKPRRFASDTTASMRLDSAALDMVGRSAPNWMWGAVGEQRRRLGGGQGWALSREALAMAGPSTSISACTVRVINYPMKIPMRFAQAGVLLLCALFAPRLAAQEVI